MSSGQGADIGNRNFEYFRESGNRRTKERRRGEGPSPGVRHLTIVQYNYGNANHYLARPLLDSLDPGKYHILTIQEPYYNTYTKLIYCPQKFQLLYNLKAVIYIYFIVS